jgi:hypothetical protein
LAGMPRQTPPARQLYPAPPSSNPSQFNILP